LYLFPERGHGLDFLVSDRADDAAPGGGETRVGEVMGFLEDLVVWKPSPSACCGGSVVFSLRLRRLDCCDESFAIFASMIFFFSFFFFRRPVVEVLDGLQMIVCRGDAVNRGVREWIGALLNAIVVGGGVVQQLMSSAVETRVPAVSYFVSWPYDCAEQEVLALPVN
jgi:hypothetical protein